MSLIRTERMDCRGCGKRGYYPVMDPVCASCDSKRMFAAIAEAHRGAPPATSQADADEIETILTEEEMIQAEEDMGRRVRRLRGNWT